MLRCFFRNKILKEAFAAIDVSRNFVKAIMQIASRTMKNNRVLNRVGFPS